MDLFEFHSDTSSVENPFISDGEQDGSSYVPDSDSDQLSIEMEASQLNRVRLKIF